MGDYARHDQPFTYKNKNRGYMQLRVWEDAIEYYVQTCKVFRGFPYELKRVAGQEMASSDSRYIGTSPRGTAGDR